VRNAVTDTYDDAERYSHGNGNDDSHTYLNTDFDSKGYPNTKAHSAVTASTHSATETLGCYLQNSVGNKSVARVAKVERSPRRLLNALAKETRLCRRIFAPFGEQSSHRLRRNRPTVRVASHAAQISKKSSLLLPRREKLALAS
jgi:hypothetical protein